MSFQFIERPESRSSTTEPLSITLVWKAIGEQNNSIVRAFADGGTPEIVAVQEGTLYRQNIAVDPDGWAQYVVRVTYGKRKRETGGYSFNFDTSGGTVNVKASKQHVATYLVGNGNVDNDNPDPHKGAIGVSADGDVAGVDIVIPALRLTVNFRHPQAVVSLAWAKQLSNFTGRVNADTFLTFEPGELLFIGASGSDGTDAEAEVAYQFIASANDDDLTIGEILGIVKLGHHYAWIEFEDEVADDAPVRNPQKVHIERVYEPLDFADSFGWGGPSG